jgi:hypothetical protein
MSAKIWEVVCDEHGIGSSGEYCGDNDAHVNRTNVLYHEVLGGKYDAFRHRAWRDRRCNSKSPFGELFSPETS